MKFLHASLACWLAWALPCAAASQAGVGSETEQLRGIVNNLMNDNAEFAKSHNADYFKSFAAKQSPRATVLTCSDSRLHAQALDKTPDGDLFMVRDIGNQISTAEGSVEYGVHHLHTPLLIVVGHVACGAIQAVQGDYSSESPAIKRELATLQLPARDPKNDDEQEWLRGVQANVNNQVAYALKKFAPEVKAGKLTVVGAVYDFQNVLQQGYGRLVITNINGATDTSGVLSRLMQISGIGASLEKKVAAKSTDNRAQP